MAQRRRDLGRVSVDDASHHLPGDRPSVAIARHGHDHILAGPAVGGGARIVTLPAAQQADVARIALVRRKGDVAAAIGNVVPHQAARLRHVHRLADDERRHVFDLAARVRRRKLQVGNDLVRLVERIELTEGEAPDLFIGDAGSAGGWRRALDDDLRDAGFD
jgi:hypothetical protein